MRIDASFLMGSIHRTSSGVVLASMAESVIRSGAGELFATRE